MDVVKTQVVEEDDGGCTGYGCDNDAGLGDHKRPFERERERDVRGEAE